MDNKTNINKKAIKNSIETTYKKGDIQRAIELCQSALIKDPTNAELHIRLGDLYLEWHLDIYQAKQYIDEAIDEYQRALESNLNSAQIYYKIGSALFHKRDLDKAINYFKMSLEKNPKNAQANYMIALSLTKKANFQEALEYCEKAKKMASFTSSRVYFLSYNLKRIAHHKSFLYKLDCIKDLLMAIITVGFDKEALRNTLKVISYFQFFPILMKAAIQSQTNGIQQAIETYQEALEKAPRFVFLYCLLGDIYRTLGRYEDAICEYKMAIWLDPMNITAYRLLCVTYEEQGDYDNAVDTYEKLIEIQPHIAEYHSNLANILYLKGEAQAAIAHYQHAITINPSLTWTSVISQTLGYVQQEIEKNHDAAISAYQTAYLLTPNDIDIYVNLGSAFYDKGDYANALTVYKKALELDAKNAKIHCNLGYLYWGQGDLEEAIKEYELAIKYDENYDIAYNNIGVIYLDDLGRVKNAMEFFEKAIRCNPNYALAHYNLARSLAICGDKVEAAKLYQVTQDLNNITNEMDPSEIQFKIKELFD